MRRLRRSCVHDLYDTHDFPSGVPGYGFTKVCPGGEFLPEGALVIEKVEGEWPDWALTILGEPPDIVRPSWTIRCLDALASRVGESE